MDRLIERCAMLDIHRDTVVACVRVPGPDGGRRKELATFGTTTRQLLALRDWLAAFEVTVVGMESTGVYWKPVFYLLEDDFQAQLHNAAHMRNMPGRKTDACDAEWGAELIEHGMVRPSFVPPKPIRELRDLTRYRKAVIEERGRETQRLHKVLEDAGIKLASVASKTLTKSGRQMMEALIAGVRDPHALAELAKGRMRAKIPALREALEGRFSGHHALIMAQMLARIDQADATIEALSTQIEGVIAPFAHQVELLRTIPGVKTRTAQVILAEIGADMSVFGDAEHLASWAGMCPGNNQSAGKRGSGRTRKGSKWLRKGLVEAAQAAGRSKDTYLSAQYARLRGRRGANKGRRGGGPHDPGHRLPPAGPRPGIRRAGRRLLRPTPRPSQDRLHQPARPPTRASRLQRQPPTSRRRLTHNAPTPWQANPLPGQCPIATHGLFSPQSRIPD